ncbi:MAG: nucleotidyltransferase family protein [Chloroflexi bacterium]|nr:nucleotidyltransferase family protein [Chloroflexota bacterium]
MEKRVRDREGGTWAVLLAAGESTRMGELKALLPWAGRSLFEFQVAQLLASPIERLVVVLGYRAVELQQRLPAGDRLVPVVNDNFRSGKVSSIVAGVDAVPCGCHVVILGVDQPRPAALVLRTLACHNAAGAPITIATYQRRRGHPVVFAPALRDELLAIDEATQGLRAVLQRHQQVVHHCDVDSPLALVNLNTPADYQAALQLWESGALASSTRSARAGNQ